MSLAVGIPTTSLKGADDESHSGSRDEQLCQQFTHLEAPPSSFKKLRTGTLMELHPILDGVLRGLTAVDGGCGATHGGTHQTCKVM